MFTPLSHSTLITSILISISLLSACSNDDAENVEAPVQKGLSSHIQASIEKDDSHLLFSLHLENDGKTVLLTGGDYLQVDNGDQQASLKQTFSEVSLFTGFVDYPSQSFPVTVDFSVQHDNGFNRDERWYPADIAYVEAEPGEHHKLQWQHQLNFPAEITLIQPTHGHHYSHSSDSVNIEWQASVNDDDLIQVLAIFDCGRDNKVLYSGVESGSFSQTIDQLFSPSEDELQATSQFDFSLEEVLKAALFFPFVRLESEGFAEAQDCNITIQAQTRHQQDIDTPFKAGSIVTARTHTAIISYDRIEAK